MVSPSTLLNPGMNGLLCISGNSTQKKDKSLLLQLILTSILRSIKICFICSISCF